MELLQIIASSVFLFSIFGIILLVISFMSYRIKKNNSKLMLRRIDNKIILTNNPVYTNSNAYQNPTLMYKNSIHVEKFTVLNDNPSTKTTDQNNISLPDTSVVLNESQKLNQLRPAKFYSLDELR